MPESAPAFPALDFSRFQWRPSPDDANLYIREAAGGEVIEDVWNRFNHGEQTLFLGLDITLHTAISPENLISHARNAWAALRFEIPTVAAKIAHDALGNTLLTYLPAASNNEVNEWAQRTVRLSKDTQGLDQLRYELSKKHIPEENGDQTFLYILPGPTEISYSLLIHTSHTPFDGAGAKILINKFLACLTGYLTGGTARPLQWGKEAENLLPCTSEVLGPDEHRQGDRYVQTLAGVMSDLGSAMPRQYGFKKRSVGPGPTRRLGYTFSASQTEQIIATARDRGFTVNHVAHAAVTLITALDNPPTPSTPADAVVVYYGLVDSRKRLAAPYSSRDGYPGYCLGMSAIQVPVSLFPSSSTLSAKELQEYLLKLASATKDEYIKQKAYPSLLAIEAQQVDMMLAGLRSGAPPPPPWMGPWYGGDGIGETYLDPVHKNSAGDAVLEVEDFFVSLNKTDPGPFFRATSWKGRLKLSVDTNEAAMPREVVQGFVDKWAEILLTLTK